MKMAFVKMTRAKMMMTTMIVELAMAGLSSENHLKMIRNKMGNKKWRMT
jgi:hypothetical protein